MEAMSQYVYHNKDFVIAVATVAAAIASICSLLVAIITVCMQRSQSRGSVRPIPFVSFGDYEQQILVSVQNRGVGPLVIDEISVMNTKTGTEKKNIIDFMPSLPQGMFWEDFIQIDIEGRPIAANEEIVMVKFSMPETLNPAIPKVRKEIREALSALTISLVVKDVYECRLKKYTRDFSWFAR